jgi:hypothetical protein
MRKQRERAVLLLLITTAISGQTIPDIRDTLEPLTLSNETPAVVFLITAAAVTIAIAIWLILRSRSRSRQRASETAEVRARRRLGAIECVVPRAFYTELHDIFIEYLESRVVKEASRRTTPELVEVLEGSRLQVDWQTSIEDFLAKCDRAKFSPSVTDFEPAASVNECLSLISRLATIPALSVAGRGRA